MTEADTITSFEHIFRSERDGCQLKLRAEFYKKRGEGFLQGSIYLSEKLETELWLNAATLSAERVRISLMPSFLTYAQAMVGREFPLQETLQEWIALLG